ncbi:MAG TPA: hypothetical protein PLV91_08335, partial [Verrucomicrobiota bacterium]|nr:hypothetical protein [Verrucomicrobiota bacterium]
AQADAISPWSGTFQISYNADGGHQTWVDAVANSIKNTLGIDASGNPYGKGGQIIKIPVGEVFSDAPQSFYRRAGNIFVWCCIIWFLREVIFSFLGRRKKQR